MGSPLLRSRYLLLPLLLLPFLAPRVFAQTDFSPEARIAAAKAVLASDPKFKGVPDKQLQQTVEFVGGNMLFVLLHELAHAVVSELDIPVLGKDEDAADSFAATKLIQMGTGLTDQVVVNAAMGWFMSDRRNKKEGDSVPYYDEHGLDQQRAYQFVCFLVGSNQEKFKQLAADTKLPEDRQASCQRDYSRAVRAWTQVLQPHLRPPDQPLTKINVVYGDGKGKLEIIAKAARAIMLLEAVAQRSSYDFAWPEPFTLEAQSCGYINAAWVASDHKLTMCYELAADFAELYKDFGNAVASTSNYKKRKSRK